MRTNVELDDALIEEAQRLAGGSSKRETIDAALREFVAGHRQRDILKLIGRDLIADDYDFRSVRARMASDPGDGPG